MTHQPFLSFLAACLGLLLSSAVSSHAAAPRADPDRLRSLARLPRINFKIEFAATVSGDFTLNDEPIKALAALAPTGRIAEIRGKLKQDRSDAPHLVELASLYGQSGATNDAGTCLQKSRAYFRESIRADPQDPFLKIQLAWILSDPEESQRLMESATASPRADALTWRNYGQFLTGRAQSALFGKPGLTNVDPVPSLNLRESSRPASEQLVRAHRWLEDARRAFDKAVAVEPTNGSSYAARAGFITVRTLLFDPLLQPSADPAAPNGKFPTGALADLQQAAKLLPEDPYAIATASIFRAMNGLNQLTAPPPDARSPITALSDADRTAWRESLARLETLTRHSRREISIAAWTALGALRLMIEQSSSGAEDAFRRALELSPRREVAWDMLAGALIMGDRWQDLEKVTADRLKAVDTARNHIQLAKVEQKLRKFDEMERNVLAAQRHDTNDVLVKLSVAAVGLMRHSRSDEELQQLGQFLQQLAPEVAQTRDRTHAMDFEFTAGLFQGLVGNREEAARTFRRLAEADSDSKEYHEALEALGR